MPRFRAVPNKHESKAKWPWAILDTTTDELCAFGSSRETAETTARSLNRNIDAIESIGIVRYFAEPK